MEISDELKKTQAINTTRKELVEQKKRELTIAKMGVDDRMRRLVGDRKRV